MFLSVPSLTNSITMKVVMLLTKETGVNAHDDAYDITRGHVFNCVKHFVDEVENGAYQQTPFTYDRDDSLASKLTEAVLTGLHKESHINGSVDMETDVKRYTVALAAAFEAAQA